MHSSKFLDFKFPSSSIFPFASYMISQLLLTQLVKKQLALFSQLLWYNIDFSSCGLVSPSLLCWFFLFLLLDCWVSLCLTSLATPSPCVISPVVVQSLSHVRLCDPVDCSMPGFPVLHYLPEIAQTHIHWVNDAIQPSHPLLPPSPPALSLSQNQVLFQWVRSSHQVAKILELQLQYQSCQWIFRVDFL